MTTDRRSVSAHPRSVRREKLAPDTRGCADMVDASGFTMTHRRCAEINSTAWPSAVDTDGAPPDYETRSEHTGALQTTPIKLAPQPTVRILDDRSIAGIADDAVARSA